jgi:hypothetical protein
VAGRRGESALVKRKKRKPDIEQGAYRATEPERAALSKQIERQNAEMPAPRVKMEEGGKGRTIALDHPDTDVAVRLLKEALGTANPDFANGLLKQLASSQGGKIDERDLNFMLAVISGIKPNDQLEAMLAAQMTAVHMAMMKFVRRLDQVENIPQQDSAERALNKLARTFTTQMETLKRYRTGGEQKVTVQHVTVGEGGQAIVGNVTQDVRGPASQKSADKPLALSDSRQQPMPIIEGQQRERELVPSRRRQKDDGPSSS